MAKSYDKMVDNNKKKSAEMEEQVVSCIKKMVADKERVTISELQKRTGYSRSTFYQNEKINAILKKAQADQGKENIIDGRASSINLATEKEVTRLKKVVDQLTKENNILKIENEKLKKKNQSQLVSLYDAI